MAAPAPPPAAAPTPSVPLGPVPYPPIEPESAAQTQSTPAAENTDKDMDVLPSASASNSTTAPAPPPSNPDASAPVPPTPAASGGPGRPYSSSEQRCVYSRNPERVLSKEDRRRICARLTPYPRLRPRLAQIAAPPMRPLRGQLRLYAPTRCACSPSLRRTDPGAGGRLR
ncbi:hypothetical protein EVG20_g4158 [Dentipellis fragilis]|uniref:Uncharacterized protein n=1 Tax=Dentipellis fragilis TaxID=205917 RepID=A0A4Y9YZB6_9AGAM|nr:hypothetical protein EVG20_g4158 [Dentipellis fragilis]